MAELSPERGDIVRSSDPFKSGDERERPWLVVNNERHPFSDEQVVAVALTTSPHLPAHPLQDDHWTVGGTPVQSYVLPWAVHSPRHDSLTAWQGRLEESFVDRVVDETVGYLE